jgi:Flp pilus assembly pilin Flp
MLIVTRMIDLWRDEAGGSELTEYAIVLTCFALASVLAMQLLDTKANTVVEKNETTYTNSLVNGY